MNVEETIAAVATPPGRGGIAVIRISGPQVQQAMFAVLNKKLMPRAALFCDFLDENQEVMDQGIALFFPAPASFTGEDVLELQGHGGPVIADHLLRRLFLLGIRLARPGEFTERAFLNNKMDLIQAESVADLINASSLQAACAALHSLQGDFSRLIYRLVESLIELRVYIEAALDFPEEEIDFLKEPILIEKTKNLIQELEMILSQAKQGVLLQEGMTVVIAGHPNAGKSTLLNALSKKDVAIVTDIPGTTRDVLRQEIQIEGLPVHIVDTAGLRLSQDKIEQEGVRRAKEEIKKADQLLWIVDITKKEKEMPAFDFEYTAPLTIVYNKIDLIGEKQKILNLGNRTEIYLSAKLNLGMDLLQTYLKNAVGYVGDEGKFTARTRHIFALKQAQINLKQALFFLKEENHGELIAEELRHAQQHLNGITGEFSNEDLLGRIFSSFCVGK